MKRPTDLGRKFLHLSDRDIKVFEKLVDDQDIPDEPLGFHAQQAIEKCLKAVLAAHEIEFRKTHDLNQLLRRRRIAGAAFAGRYSAIEPIRGAAAL